MAEPRNRYSIVSLTLHWGIALMVVIQVGLITAHEAVDGDMSRTLIGWHKSVGMTILALTLARIVWRLMNPALPLPGDTPRWQRILARSTHVLFYVLLIALPLAGWASSSAAGRAVEWFGLFRWPLLPVPVDRSLARTFLDAHEAGVKVLYVVLALHVAGALKHHFMDRDNILHRMLPFIPRRP